LRVPIEHVGAQTIHPRMGGHDAIDPLLFPAQRGGILACLIGGEGDLVMLTHAPASLLESANTLIELIHGVAFVARDCRGVIRELNQST